MCPRGDDRQCSFPEAWQGLASQEVMASGASTGRQALGKRKRRGGGMGAFRGAFRRGFELLGGERERQDHPHIDIVGHFEGFTAALRLRVLWHPQNSRLFAKESRRGKWAMGAAALPLLLEVERERVWSMAKRKDGQPGERLEVVRGELGCFRVWSV